MENFLRKNWQILAGLIAVLGWITDRLILYRKRKRVKIDFSFVNDELFVFNDGEQNIVLTSVDIGLVNIHNRREYTSTQVLAKACNIILISKQLHKIYTFDESFKNKFIEVDETDKKDLKIKSKLGRITIAMDPICQIDIFLSYKKISKEKSKEVKMSKWIFPDDDYEKWIVTEGSYYNDLTNYSSKVFFGYFKNKEFYIQYKTERKGINAAIKIEKIINKIVNNKISKKAALRCLKNAYKKAPVNFENRIGSKDINYIKNKFYKNKIQKMLNKADEVIRTITNDK